MNLKLILISDDGLAAEEWTPFLETPTMLVGVFLFG
jgi:hypothetical protein